MKYTPEYVKEVIQRTVTGKIEPQHNERGHWYKFVETGEVTASVTSKLILEKPHLIPWAIGLAIDFLMIPSNYERLQGPEKDLLIKSAKLQYTDVRDNAGSIGHEAHAIIEEYEKKWIETGVKPETIMTFISRGTRSQVIAACRSGEKAFAKYDLTPVSVEILVGVSGIGAGTLDLIAMNPKGELELIDWKTSNQIAQETYNMQVCAYRHFFEKMTGLKIKRSKIFKIDKSSDKFKIYNVENHKTGLKAFKAISLVYDWVNNGEGKCVEDKIIIKI